MLAFYLSLLETEQERSDFEKLYHRYRKSMFYVAKRILRDFGLAEDAVQESFLRVAKHFEHIQDVDSPETKGYLMIITRNVALDVWRKQRRMAEQSLDEMMVHETEEKADLLAGSENVEQTVLHRAQREAIREAALRIPATARDVLYLYYVYGMKTSEIAGLLRISVEAARKRLQRGRVLLRKELEKQDE